MPSSPSSSLNKRSLEVDFFRGVVLIAIVLDHVSGSVLSHATLHVYAMCDATEVFVFLGGFASASAYLVVSERRDRHAATLRFLTRAWQIYRAFLLTAALMLIVGMVLGGLGIKSLTLDYTDAAPFEQHPLRVLTDVVTLRLQPYLSAVLPMYALYALFVPLIMAWARKRPVAVLGLSLAVWLAAPWLARGLPSVDHGGWSFNPFAWQLMFVMGVLIRIHPLSEQFEISPRGRAITQAAIAVTLAFAIYKLFLESVPEPGSMKQNLSIWRVLNFLSIAWLGAQTVRLKWASRLAARLPWVISVGQQSLACFVSGAVISVVSDSILDVANGGSPSRWHQFSSGLAVDALSIAAVLVVGLSAQKLKGRAPPLAVRAEVARRRDG